MWTSADTVLPNNSETEFTVQFNEILALETVSVFQH